MENTDGFFFRSSLVFISLCNIDDNLHCRYGMQNYIRDNGGFIKRMYGDARFDRGPSKVRAQGPVTSSSTDRMSRKDDGV